MKSIIFALCALSLSAPITAPSQPQSGASLEVHVDYKGSGAIDESHKIFVALWDSADFVNNSSQIPLSVMSLSSKSGTVKFDDIRQNPVYVSMAYDPTGKWQGDSAPPAGSSLGLYSKQPGIPAPVTLAPGKTTKISAVLDDSFKKQ